MMDKGNGGGQGNGSFVIVCCLADCDNAANNE